MHKMNCVAQRPTIYAAAIRVNIHPQFSSSHNLKKKRKKKAEKKQGFTQAKFEFAFSTQLPLISDSGINVEEKKRQTLR